MNIAILGSTGMIGSATTLYLSDLEYDVIEVNRQGVSITGENDVHKFDVIEDSVKHLLGSLPSDTVLINLIGVIRHKIDSKAEKAISIARQVNSDFPKQLVHEAQELGLRVIQIATDCVYSGKAGSYYEDSKADPLDIYGETKNAGEVALSNLLTLRVSIVGREIKDHVELMDWVISQPLNAQVNGFKNHIWNGITSLHFAKILEGILKNRIIPSGTFHLIPSDRVNKLELIKLIAEMSGRRDLKIIETMADQPVDRSLASNFNQINAEFWRCAGYPVIPSIRMMLEEYFAWIRPIDQGE